MTEEKSSSVKAVEEKKEVDTKEENKEVAVPKKFQSFSLWYLKSKKCQYWTYLNWLVY